MLLRIKCRFKGLKNFKNNQKFKRDTRTGWLGLLSVHANWLYVNTMFQTSVGGQAANLRCPMVADTAAGHPLLQCTRFIVCGDRNLSSTASHKPQGTVSNAGRPLNQPRISNWMTYADACLHWRVHLSRSCFWSCSAAGCWEFLARLVPEDSWNSLV